MRLLHRDMDYPGTGHVTTNHLAGDYLTCEFIPQMVSHG